MRITLELSGCSTLDDAVDASGAQFTLYTVEIEKWEERNQTRADATR